jgi:large subunit ribosomal protein L22
MITARLNDYRQSPRKVRLVANLIKGKKVEDAKNILTFTVKRASNPILDLLNSAVANAKNNFNLEKDILFIKNITVNEGVVLKRRMPRARGMAYPIKKRNSHVCIELDTVENMPKTKSQVKKEAYVKKTAKKIVKK